MNSTNSYKRAVTADRRLNNADPGNGHGVRRHDHPLS